MNSMTPSVALPRPGALDAFLRRRLLAQLAPMRDGRLCVRDALGEVWLGDARGELHVTVTIDDPAFYRKVARRAASAPAKATSRANGTVMTWSH
jgi:cyclopropane-fatty-acyl-phospholipid synthase